MDSKKIIFVLVLFAIFFLSLLFFFRKDISNASEPNLQSQEKSLNLDSRISPLGSGDGFWDEALSPFREDKSKSYLELLEELRTGKINFVWEVWALRRKCKPEYTPEQCDSTILAYIDSEYESPDREKIRDLFVSYFKYEETYRNWKQPTDLSFVDLYQKIKDKRREVLGEKADLIFGMEEAQVDFTEGAANFLKTTENMNPEARVKAYNDFKKKSYGTYFDSLVSREDSFDNYQMELVIREKDLNSFTLPEEKEKYLNKIETRYFGKEKASALASERQKERQFSDSISNYEKQEKEFLRLNANLSQKDRDQKLKELRIKILGSEEEADAYLRRKNIEEAEKNLF